MVGGAAESRSGGDETRERSEKGEGEEAEETGERKEMRGEQGKIPWVGLET